MKKAEQPKAKAPRRKKGNKYIARNMEDNCSSTLNPAHPLFLAYEGNTDAQVATMMQEGLNCEGQKLLPLCQ